MLIRNFVHSRYLKKLPCPPEAGLSRLSNFCCGVQSWNSFAFTSYRCGTFERQNLSPLVRYVLRVRKEVSGWPFDREGW